jgi:hypothetical protein
MRFTLRLHRTDLYISLELGQAEQKDNKRAETDCGEKRVEDLQLDFIGGTGHDEPPFYSVVSARTTGGVVVFVLLRRS